VTCDIHTPAMCETGGSNESGKRGAGNFVVNDSFGLKNPDGCSGGLFRPGFKKVY
jgi:hypothetical protein